MTISDESTPWGETRLRYQAQLNPSVRLDIRESPGTDVTFLAMESIGEDGTIRADTSRPVVELLNGYSYFENSDVLIAKVTPCFENGKGALITGLPHNAGFGTTEVTVLRAKSSINPRFLFYLTSEDRFKQGGVASMTGAGGLKRVPDSYVRNFEFALPTIAEQLQIADYLDRETAKIDALVEKQERLMETLAERRQAVIVNVLENQARPEAEAAGVRMKNLYSVMDRRRGAVDLPLLSVSIHHGVRRRDETTDDEPRSDDLSTYKVCDTGDIVVNRMRAFQGAIGIAPERGIVSPDYLVLRPSTRTDGLWLTNLMRSRWFVSEMTRRLRGIGNTESGAVRTPRINAADLGDISVVLPTVKEQRIALSELAREESKMADLSAKAREMIDVLKERRQALISAAVTGKIDVRGLV